MDRPFSPASERNKQPILEGIRGELGSVRDVLEIGSGTGQHAVFFAQQLPHLDWQPSDRSAALPGLIRGVESCGLSNLRGPLELDVRVHPWPVTSASAVFSANTCHIMGWPAVCAMFEGVGRLLADGPFLVYGPFNRGGRYTSASNQRFDESLRAADPERGLRDLEALRELARGAGLELAADRAMPAHNALLVWRRATGARGC